MTSDPVDPQDVDELLNRVQVLSEVSPGFRVQLKQLLATAAQESRLPSPFDGPVRDIIVHLPASLVEEIHRLVGPEMISQYVTDALIRRVEVDRLEELSAWLEEEYGPIPEEALAEARRIWSELE